MASIHRLQAKLVFVSLLYAVILRLDRRIQKVGCVLYPAIKLQDDIWWLQDDIWWSQDDFLWLQDDKELI